MDLKEIIYIFTILSVISIFSWWISLVLKYSKKKKLSEKDKKELKILFKKIKNLPSDFKEILIWVNFLRNFEKKAKWNIKFK